MLNLVITIHITNAKQSQRIIMGVNRMKLFSYHGCRLKTIEIVNTARTIYILHIVIILHIIFCIFIKVIFICEQAALFFTVIGRSHTPYTLEHTHNCVSNGNEKYYFFRVTGNSPFNISKRG